MTDVAGSLGPPREENDDAALLLGAIAWLDRFAAAALEPAAGQVEPREPDALRDAALGLLSVQRTLLRWAAHAAGDHERAPPTPTPARPTDLLR